MRHWIAGLFCMLLAWTVWAGPNDIRKTAEASMLVTGWIDVAPDGSVHDYTIDRPEKIPPSVIDLIHASVPGWKFHFAEHVDAIQRAKMNLRILAKPIDDQHDTLAINGATFGDGAAAATDHVTAKNMQHPKYPRAAVEARVDGTVFLLLRVGRQGQVEDAAVEQVNLGVYGREAQMAHFRAVLGDAALEAARKWTYNAPTTGQHVADPYWYLRVPVAFNLHVRGMREDTYGKWEPYIPGPREWIPWAKNDNRLSSSSDAIPEEGISQVDQSLQLTTALTGA
jgi:TonB family protein